MKLLIVEDEAPTAAYLRRGMSEEGFDVDVAAGIPAAETAAALASYDIILLDVMLPGGSGFDLCLRWRKGGMTTPILFLTARDDITDRVQGLNLGGDDYLVKPFAFDELLARVRALLRRRGAPTPMKRLRAGDLQLDPERRRVTRGSEVVPFTAREYRLLEYFALNPGKIVTRADIWEHVWDGEAEPDSNVVDVYVRYLRNKLGRAPVIIETVRGAGYVLNAPNTPEGGADEQQSE